MTTHKPALRNRAEGFDCGDCGMRVDGREYHPYWFCVLHKAGQDPRAILRDERQRWEQGR